MHSATFIGEVQQGRLHIDESLGAFEGKRVLVTLIAPDTPLSVPVQAGHTPGPLASPEAEILEDTGRIRSDPRASQTVTARIVAVGRRSPGPSVEEE